MRSIRNRISLIGYVGGHPDVRTLANGQLMARFDLATTESHKHANGDRIINETQWHSLIAWGKTADIVSRFVGKGQQMAVEGRIISRSYTDELGVKHYITEIEVCDLLMLGRGP